MLVKLDHFPRDPGENQKYLKPPTRSNRFSETKHTNLCNASEPLSSRNKTSIRKMTGKPIGRDGRIMTETSLILWQNHIFIIIYQIGFLNPTVSHQQKIPTSCQSHMPHHIIGTSHVPNDIWNLENKHPGLHPCLTTKTSRCVLDDSYYSPTITSSHPKIPIQRKNLTSPQ